MPNKVILDYLSENLKKGYPASKLRQKLLAAGYPQNEVDEALRYLGSGTRPIPASSPLAAPEEKELRAKEAHKPPVEQSQELGSEEDKKDKKAREEWEKEKKELEQRKKEQKKEQEKREKQDKEKEKKRKELEQRKREQEKGEKQKEELKKKEQEEKDKQKKQHEKHKQKKSKPGQGRRKRSINSNKIIFIAAVIAIVEVGSFIGLVSIGIIDVRGSQPCVEDWTCASWMPRTCPPNATQSRRCFDANNCGTSLYMPDTQQSCVPVEGGPYIFTEHDFSGAGMDVADFTHFTRGLDINGTTYDSYISVATSGSGAVVRTSVSYGPVVNLVYDFNEDVMYSMKINRSRTGEFGTRSSRYEVSDLDSATLLIQDGEWFMAIEYETNVSVVADNLAGVFIQKTP